MAYSHQDWKPVILRVKQEGNGKSEKDVRTALQNGAIVETRIRDGSGVTQKLDDNREDFHHKQIPKELADAVKNKRIELKLTQVQLAQRINEKVNIIQDIEGMKSVYNHVMINKTLKALGLSLKQIGL
jgi:ribosome-binding protein aMBF1 (putative translation factor)